MHKRLPLVLSALFASTFLEADITNSQKAPTQKPLQTLTERMDLLPSQLTINRIQIHRWADLNGNNTYDIPYETIQIYEAPELNYGLYIKDPIPAKGNLFVMVPQHPFWGSCIRATCKNIDAGPRSEKLVTKIDLTATGPTNSYRGKPQGIFPLPIGSYKELHRKKHDAEPKGTQRFYIAVDGDNGLVSYWCSFALSFDVPETSSTNAPTIKK